MKPIIFLDIDGVLRTIKERSPKLNAGCVGNLNWLTSRANAEIVVSSTWRHMMNPTIDEKLRFFGVTAKVIGITPDLSRGAKLVTPAEAAANPGGRHYTNRATGMTKNPEIILGATRGAEIQSWLDRHPGRRRFVILDDDDDMDGLASHLIQCKFEDGLTVPLAVMAYRHLTK